MKRLLSIALFGLVAAASVSAQAHSIDNPSTFRSPGDGARNAPPVTNPEPITLVALAGGAAVAGSLLRRRKNAN